MKKPRSTKKAKPSFLTSDSDMPAFLEKFGSVRSYVIDVKSVIFHGTPEDILEIAKATNEASEMGIFQAAWINQDPCLDCRQGEIHFQVNMIPHKRTSIQ